MQPPPILSFQTTELLPGRIREGIVYPLFECFIEFGVLSASFPKFIVVTFEIVFETIYRPLVSVIDDRLHHSFEV